VSTYSKDKTIMKTIRISQVENDNWDSDKIHSFLDGKFIDTEILKKILVKFIDLEVSLEDTTEIEDKRIMELISECQLI